MIELPSFIDLHTHTRYPDKNNFPFLEIEKAALNGGYSEVLAMANSEITIDSIENLKLARSIDKKLSIKVHRVGALSKNLDGILVFQGCAFIRAIRVLPKNFNNLSQKHYSPRDAFRKRFFSM